MENDHGVSLNEDICVYTCKPGYLLIGNNVRMCQKDGSWSGTEPKCKRGMSNVSVLVKCLSKPILTCTNIRKTLELVILARLIVLKCTRSNVHFQPCILVDD